MNRNYKYSNKNKVNCARILCMFLVSFAINTLQSIILLKIFPEWNLKQMIQFWKPFQFKKTYKIVWFISVIYNWNIYNILILSLNYYNRIIYLYIITYGNIILYYTYNINTNYINNYKLKNSFLCDIFGSIHHNI